jgi:hypothetical protein
VQVADGHFCDLGPDILCASLSLLWQFKGLLAQIDDRAQTLTEKVAATA